MVSQFDHHPDRVHEAEVQRCDAFIATLPAERGPVICSLPHSSREYPPEFLDASVLNATQIRSSEDAFVDMLLEDFPAMGVGLFAGRAPRAYLDLNRSETELDPQVVRGVTRSRSNPRLNSGLGVIPRVVAGGRQIYHGKISLEEAQTRIARFHRPYHERLAALLASDRAKHGHSLLLDWHSMPHEAVITPDGTTPEIILGDLFGKSASQAVIDLVSQVFRDEGFVVARNRPFAGAYILERHGRPERGQHALQIEIDRALYMDEERVEPHKGMADLKRRLEAVMQRILLAYSGSPLMAAE